MLDGDQLAQRLTAELQSCQAMVSALSSEDDVIASALTAVAQSLAGNRGSLDVVEVCAFQLRCLLLC